MKPFLIVVVLFAAAIVQAQTTTMEASMKAQINGQLRRQTPAQELLALPPQRPNEIIAGPVTYSGIFVQLTKVDDPLQLINPAAPAEYGTTEDNTVIDPLTGRGSGLKLLSVGF